MGFVDARTARPNRQWELLRNFAQSNGILHWKSAGASPHNKKRKQYLVETLVAFFRIPGEPIERICEPKGWKALFELQSGSCRHYQLADRRIDSHDSLEIR
jgi:hypothetical protein